MGLLAVVPGIALFAATGLYNVMDFGAVGDGQTKDTVAVQKAIDAAAADGGGEVLLPAGAYLCGTVYLKDNVDFHLDAGAVLKGSTDSNDYCKADFARQNWASPREGDNTSGGHLLVAVGRHHVTVRGPGKIDGSGSAFLVDPSTGTNWDGWKAGIPWRPGQMVWICDCSDVRLDGVELADSPYWTCNLHNCERVRIHGCYVHNERRKFQTWNGDGIDIDRCQHVTLSDCRIDTTDDCITLRASGAARLRIPKDCAFVAVSNCTLSSSCNAVRLGVGEGRIHDATFDNLTIADTSYAFNFVAAYSPKNRGTDICAIRISDVRADAEQFLWMHHKHSTQAVFDDIVFESVSGTARRPSLIDAKETAPFRRIRFEKVDMPLGVKILNADVSTRGGTFFVRNPSLSRKSDNLPSPVRMAIWPEGQMPSEQTNQSYAPYLEWYAPRIVRSKAVVISVSGGGYMSSGNDGFEVTPIRNYLLERGVTVVAMRYRAPRPVGLPKHLTAWQDAQRAIRVVRREAVRRGLDSDRIGFTGCSAGGHLAVLAAVSSTVPAYDRIDALDDTPCNVNFAIPVYPAYVLVPESEKCDVEGCDDLAAPFCPEFAFDVKTPPMCLVHGDADVWSPMGSVRIYHKLRTMKIPAELHIMSGEGHCFMKHPERGTPAEKWKDRVWEWLVKTGQIEG